MKKKKLELLAPAANAEIAFQAVLHGADAIYIGATSHGARKEASNSLDDISRVVDFAHQYRVKVYVTINTIVYENEIRKVEELCRDLYHIGVDALIIQDMGILRMKIPPISLHASTQCDIRTPAKAKFLEEVGFSQIVLARELSLEEIRNIVDVVDIPVECFVHGALCVSYSGRCHASYSTYGRSANRGECAQICRLPYSLIDAEGKKLAENKYFLSLKDLNSTPHVKELVDIGVSSFKIEGRLKNISYVKNITAHYNSVLNEIIKDRPDSFTRSSFGDSSINFQPQPEKSFNRGFTDYFLTRRQPLDIASLLSPKSKGERITDISLLNNGDGISFINDEGQYTGVNINGVEKGKIIPARKVRLPKDTPLFRTFDIKWEKDMKANTSERKVEIDFILEKKAFIAEDSMGNRVIMPVNIDSIPAKTKQDYKSIFEKLGHTPYKLRKFISKLPEESFYPKSTVTALRRELVERIIRDNQIKYPYQYRRKEKADAIYPFATLDFKDNVANSLAENFYRQHGVSKIEKALEINENIKEKGRVVMTTRHCVLRELGLCRKKTIALNKQVNLPVYLFNEKIKFKLRFNCEKCEMEVLNL